MVLARLIVTEEMSHRHICCFAFSSASLCHLLAVFSSYMQSHSLKFPTAVSATTTHPWHIASGCATDSVAASTVAAGRSLVIGE